jgi:hypothetical protein
VKTVLVFALCVLVASPAWAQQGSIPLRRAAVIQSAFETGDSGAVDSTRPVAAPDRRVSPAVSHSNSTDSWPKRHAVLLGTLVGFAGGFVIGAKTCRYPTAEGDSCSDYTYPANAQLLGGFTIGAVGAAIGAGVGAIIRATR